MEIVCKHICLPDIMSQVQVRALDRWIEEGRFKSRSDAMRVILAQYEERERTREFYRMLNQRTKEAREHPEELIPLE